MHAEFVGGRWWTETEEGAEKNNDSRRSLLVRACGSSGLVRLVPFWCLAAISCPLCDAMERKGPAVHSTKLWGAVFLNLSSVRGRMNAIRNASLYSTNSVQQGWAMAMLVLVILATGDDVAMAGDSSPVSSFSQIAVRPCLVQSSARKHCASVSILVAKLAYLCLRNAVSVGPTLTPGEEQVPATRRNEDR